MNLYKKSTRSLLFLTVIFISTSIFAAASSSEPNGISIFFLVVGLLGGMGMFLYGMEMMSDGMKLTAGNSMRMILEKLTSNRFLAVFVGAFVTMVIQSSSATTVMLVSFVNSGLLSFTNALGVILGSNIGSTVTAQIVAFKVTDYALILIAAGAFMTLFSKKDTFKNLGFVILGFGLLFYGMKVMSETMKPLRTDPTFNSILTSFENPFLGILAGACFTALIQSSSATTGIVITLASGGSITLEAGIPLIFGANIGTCVTALLSGLNASRDAKRVAIGHVTFNVLGVLLFAFWIPTFSEFISTTSDNIPRQIANAHTIFNIMATVVFIPFTGIISKAIIRFFPDKIIEHDISKPQIKNLDSNLLNEPSVAITNAQAEIGGVVALMERVIGSVIRPFIRNQEDTDIEDKSMDLVSGLHQRVDKISYLNSHITDYLQKISRSDITETQSKELFILASSVNYLQSMNSIVNGRFDILKAKKDVLNDYNSVSGQSHIIEYHKKMLKQIKRLNKCFIKFDRSKAEKIISKGKKFNDIDQKYDITITQLEKSQSVESIEAYKIHTELMDILKQMNMFTQLITAQLVDFDSYSQST